MSELLRAGIAVIPEPREVTLGEGAFDLSAAKGFALADGASEADRFAADCLRRILRSRFGIELAPGRNEGAVRLLRDPSPDVAEQGYALNVTQGGVRLRGRDEAGLYYGVQTLVDLARRADGGTVELPCVTIRDWPDTPERAVHYDTKHHQDRPEYVRWLIETLAHYRINVLIWEWEDKLAYESHPEVGAPGAFTKRQMQDFTAFARRRHVQLVPLVQGLGHVSYILKHGKWRALREIPDSNWQFCPLKDGSYGLLFDLWDEAIEATPGTKYLHVGCDETYELGEGVECGCRDHAREHGKSRLMDIFLRRVQDHLKERGRTMMAWAGGPAGEHARPGVQFSSGRDRERDAAARQAGHKLYCYAPNPGIEPLFLPLQPFRRTTLTRPDYDRDHPGSLTRTREVVASAARSGTADGMVCTSWDDSGLHISMWMPRFVCAAEYSWSGGGAGSPALDEWKAKFARSYFGPEVRDLWRLYRCLQESAWFYYDSFQRKVWHYGDVGKIHLPDLPRWEGLEYSDFWRRRHADLLKGARADMVRIEEALDLIQDNLSRPLRNRYDFELYLSIARLCRHNARLVLALGEIEGLVQRAHACHYTSRVQALRSLREAVGLARGVAAEREEVFAHLVGVWEKTRLPKGLSTADKEFVHVRDRARHFANRVADMRYLIVDEEMLGLDGWADSLAAYVAEYEKRLES